MCPEPFCNSGLRDFITDDVDGGGGDDGSGDCDEGGDEADGGGDGGGDGGDDEDDADDDADEPESRTSTYGLRERDCDHRQTFAIRRHRDITVILEGVYLHYCDTSRVEYIRRSSPVCVTTPYSPSLSFSRTRVPYARDSVSQIFFSPRTRINEPRALSKLCQAYVSRVGGSPKWVLVANAKKN